MNRHRVCCETYSSDDIAHLFCMQSVVKGRRSLYSWRGKLEPHLFDLQPKNVSQICNCNVDCFALCIVIVCELFASLTSIRVGLGSWTQASWVLVVSEDIICYNVGNPCDINLILNVTSPTRTCFDKLKTRYIFESTKYSSKSRKAETFSYYIIIQAETFSWYKYKRDKAETCSRFIYFG